MATPKERSLEETPTWAVAVVCAIFVIISILIEHGIHSLGKPGYAGDSGKDSNKGGGGGGDEDRRRKLLSYAEDMVWRRVLASSKGKDSCPKGKVALITQSGMHDLHIFIFALAVFHVLYSVATILLAKAKMKKWESWESETKTLEYQYRNDPSRFRLTHQTSFVKRHSGFSTIPGMRWIILVLVGTKLELIIMEMAEEIQERSAVVRGAPVVEPNNKYFWFNRPRWILFLIHYTLFQNAFQMAYFLWVVPRFLYPRETVLCSGKGCSWAVPSNSMQLHYLPAVFLGDATLQVHRVLNSSDTLLRDSLYARGLEYFNLAKTLRMGSHMKTAIFEEQTAKALKNWRKAAKKRNKQKEKGGGGMSSPMSVSMSGNTTPSRGTSPLHLLHNHKHRSTASDQTDGVLNSPTNSNCSYPSDTDLSDIEAAALSPPQHLTQLDDDDHHQHNIDFSFVKP
ncbi:MLO protein-like protein 1-like [Gossypium australe]|uniref:MLO-like protein n=1 Tax=Gossypium australe TaxID=47621 RepID=A0A5B6VDP8_9ROSI|nr:MLO protein-like protein 1-like [Gossypium australe]